MYSFSVGDKVIEISYTHMNELKSWLISHLGAVVKYWMISLLRPKTFIHVSDLEEFKSQLYSLYNEDMLDESLNVNVVEIVKRLIKLTEYAIYHENHIGIDMSQEEIEKEILEVDDMNEIVDIEVKKSPSKLEKLPERLTSKAKKVMSTHTYENCTKRESEIINEAKFEGFENRLSYRDIKLIIYTKAPVLEDKLTSSELETIIRTELLSLYAKMRQFSYEEMEDFVGEKFKYTWEVVGDDRLTDGCRKLSEDTKKGVSLKRLKSMVNEYSRKYYPKLRYRRDFKLHPNCRCVFVRKV